MSLEFGVLFFALLLIYYVVPGKLQWYILLAGSLLYYHFSAADYTVVFVVFSVTTTYFAARYFDRTADDKALRSKRKAVLLVTIIANVLILLSLKQLNGFLHFEYMFASRLSPDAKYVQTNWIAPLGVSIYTLMLVSYLCDTYWGVSKAQKNPLKLALYAVYFPAIGSGPVSRYNQIENELFTAHAFRYKNLTFGLQRMLYGLFKKLIIADRIALITAPIFADSLTYRGGYIWVAMILTVFQFYTDFSGNMDFILGVSECFGIALPENFKQPLFALTTQEFWQRWNITLGQWLKDYIMFPILRTKAWGKLGKWCKVKFGKKAAKIIPTFLAMLILWIAQGTWHGAYPKYIATAVEIWLILLLSDLLRPVFTKINTALRINTECFSWRLFQRIRTFILYASGLVFFVNDGVLEALKMFRSSLTINPWALFSADILNLYGGWIGLIVIALGITAVVKVDSYNCRLGSVRVWLAGQNLVFRWVLLLAMIFAVIIFGVYGPGYDAREFIYAGF